VSNDLFDPPAPILRERDLAARREHLLRELERTHGRPLRRLGRRTALAVVLAALIVALAAALPGRIGRGKMTLIDRAIAAIGTGPTTHVVLDEGLGTRLVDFRTGRTTPASMRIEFWSDPKLGTLRISTLNGKPLQTIFVPPSRSAPEPDWWRPFVTGYRSQLRAGAYHLIGNGQMAGQAINWIASKPQSFRDASSGALHEEVREIAISRSTYLPLYWRIRIDGVIQPDSGVRVISAETLPRRPSLFAHRRPLSGAFGSTPSAPPTTLAQARAAMNPDPVVPPERLAGLRRTWVGLPRYLRAFNSYRDQIGGVELFYGHIDYAGFPVYGGSFISITEFPHRNPVIDFQGLALFPDDAAIITNRTATMKTHGLYVIIEAGSPGDTLAAARALAVR
jgi:hypothetical protein